jgi:hypothetical protein
VNEEIKSNPTTKSGGTLNTTVSIMQDVMEQLDVYYELSQILMLAY